MARNKFEIEGMNELEKMIKDIGSLPQKCVTGAAKAGANIALKSARDNAPFETGNLRKGIVIKGEKKTTKGKKVYDIGMDPKMRDVFVRTTKSGKRRVNVKRARSKRYKTGDYYYPASMEFGFMKADGTKEPGHHFLRDSLVKNKDLIISRVLLNLSERLDKLINKGR